MFSLPLTKTDTRAPLRADCAISRGAVAILCAILVVGTLHSQTPDVQAKFRLAQGFEQAGEWERAAELYRELLQNEKGNFTLFDGLQRMYVQLKRYDDAISVIRERLAMSPNDPTLYGMLGTVQYRAGLEPEAMSAWQHAISLAPENQQSYRLVANLMIENRLLDRAAEIYRKGRVACHDPQLFTIELAQLLVASMDYAGATEEFLQWLAQNPAQIAFVQNRLAAFTYKEDGRGAATRVVQAHIADHPDLRLYELLAWLHMEGKDFDRGFEVYRRIDELSGANGMALLGFADRVFRERAYDIAARAYREAMGRPLPLQRIPQARYGQACALKELQVVADSGSRQGWNRMRPLDEARARLTEAVAAFAKIAEEYPRTEYSAKSQYQIGLLQLRNFQDLNSASRTFQMVLAEPAATPSVRIDVQLRMGELLIARADTTNAVAALRTVVSSPGATPDQIDEAQLRLAEIAFFNGHVEDAVKLLSTIATNVRNDFANDALELQALLQENTGGPPQALTQYGRAEFLARQHRNSEAVQLLMDLVRAYPGSPLIDDALLRAGGLLTQAGLYQDAVALYDRLLTQFHEQSKMLDRALFRMGETYQFGLAQPAAAISAYERLLSEQGQSLLANEARKRIRALRGETL
jgi:tetratricopeptide (TPR) repeat protein